MPYPEQPLADIAFLSSGVSQSNVELIVLTFDSHYYHFSQWDQSKPQGYELLFNLSDDQDFWKIA
jgi:alkyl hydroperoxide reductase subunit AhpC